MTLTLTELNRPPCNSARSRVNGGYHPNFKPIHTYPAYYWCHNCGSGTGPGSRLNGWKKVEHCKPDKGGKLRCPDCGQPVRLTPGQYRVEKYRKRTERRRNAHT